MVIYQFNEMGVDPATFGSKRMRKLKVIYHFDISAVLTYFQIPFQNRLLNKFQRIPLSCFEIKL